MNSVSTTYNKFVHIEIIEIERGTEGLIIDGKGLQKVDDDGMVLRKNQLVGDIPAIFGFRLEKNFTGEVAVGTRNDNIGT
uniref:FHA domain-containing protein n=1 Tax=Panagrellus redivivus TaxID=6233 RepID=A0A7E4VFH5_PANRE